MAEKSGFQMNDNASMDSLKEFADRMTQEAMQSMQKASESGNRTSNAEPLVVTVSDANPPA